MLYESLGTARRVKLHQAIGARLEAGYGARAGEIAAQLAVHFERAGAVQRAVYYWQQTGEKAGWRYAYPEALAALRKGLALLATLPESPSRTQDELTLLLSLGELLIIAKGAATPEVGEVYTRASTLCHQLEESPQHFQALQGLQRFHVTQAQLPTAGELAQQLTHLARRQGEVGRVLEGQAAVGAVALLRGDLVVARDHLEPYLSLSDPLPPTATTFHGVRHLRVTYLAWMMQVLWELGYTAKAQQRHAEMRISWRAGIHVCPHRGEVETCRLVVSRSEVGVGKQDEGGKLAIRMGNRARLVDRVAAKSSGPLEIERLQMKRCRGEPEEQHPQA